MAEANPTNLSDEDPTKMCDHCSFRGINTQAGTFCLVCSEYLCNVCEVVHRCSKASRDHELKPFEESRRLSIKQKALISTIMVCDNHRIETLTLFCVDHSIAVCNVCNTTKHRKCNTKDLKLISKDANKKNDVIQCIEKLKTLLSESKEIEHSREEDKTLIENRSRKCIQEVRKIKQQIITCAERLAYNMEEKISIARNQIIAEMESDRKAVINTSEQMELILSSFETLGKEIDDAAFVLMMKEKGNIQDGIEMKDEIVKQVKPVKLEFQPSHKLVTLMSEITTMGSLEVKDQPISKPKTVDKREHQLSFPDISPTNTVAIDAETENVTGCVFMPDGKLVICDESNKSVKAFTLDFKLKNELKIGSFVWDVAVVSKTEVIVTKPILKSLQFVTVSTGIMKGKSISVGMTCWGIDCKNDKLYVSCHENNGKGGIVKVLTMVGVTVNTFNISQGHPDYLAVNNSGDRIIVSIYEYGVVCIDTTGNTLYTYSNSQLKCSRGVLFDANDNVMMCGKGSKNIHVLKNDGNRNKILLTRDDGLFLPHCLAYRPSDNILVVGQMFTSGSLLAFNTN